jgi:hypothetical protein
MRALPYHYECSHVVQARARELFEHVDDHARLSSHMSQSSVGMAGARMTIEVDEGRGRAIGSRIRLIGRILGIRLFVDEVVMERDPPHRKVWETVGQPRLLVIGHYRMGYDIAPQSGGSQFRVFIDYALPEATPARWFGRMFGGVYARWCTQRMVNDAVLHFLSPAKPAAA